MGLFDRFRHKKSESSSAFVFPATLLAPSEGKLILMEKIPDPVFAQGMLGFCCGIEPVQGNVFAPVDGKILQIAETKHAIGMEAGGVEILIHMGLDTVEMNGEGFVIPVQVGQRVHAGDRLCTMDLKKIETAGHNPMVIVAIPNSADYDSIEWLATSPVRTGTPLLRIHSAN